MEHVTVLMVSSTSEREVNRQALERQKVANRLRGLPPLPTRVGKWKADFNASFEYFDSIFPIEALYVFQGEGDFSVLVAAVRVPEGVFPQVMAAEEAEKHRVLHIMDGSKSESLEKAHRVAINWMAEHQSRREIKAALEESQSVNEIQFFHNHRSFHNHKSLHT